MKFSNELKLDFDDVLIEPQRSTIISRKEVDIEREFTFINSPLKWKGVPIIAANMDTTGTFEMAEALFEFKMLVAIHKHYSLEQWTDFYKKHKDNNSNIFNHIMVSSGVSDNDYKKIVSVLSLIKEIKFICIDIANGYSTILEEFVKKVRNTFPEKVIVAGNVVSKNMTEPLILAGADIVKVGIGPGSVCTTRVVTGVGMPQLSAIVDCADAAHGLKGHIIGDGGCKTPADISKALCAGADFVMLGGMLAGHFESGGELFTDEQGNEFKKFYGMSSSEAMHKHSGGVSNYRASEGKVVLIPYKGLVTFTIQQLLGGIRSTCTYIGAAKIKEMPKRATFNLVNRQVNTVFGLSDGLSKNNK